MATVKVDQPGHVDEHRADPEGEPAQRRAHPLGLRPEGHQRHVLEHQRHAEHQEDLHLVGSVDDPVHEAALDDRPPERTARPRTARSRA